LITTGKIIGILFHLTAMVLPRIDLRLSKCHPD